MLCIVEAADLGSLPDPEPLLGGVLDIGDVGVVTGPAGSGASFLALDWACSIASGTRWLGKHDADASSVLYVGANLSTRLRVSAWQKEHPAADLTGHLALIPEPVQLSDPEQVSDLCAEVRARQARLVVIDPLARCMVGLDENSALDMGIAIDAFYHIRDAAAPYGTAFLVLHHTGWGNKTRTRGSAALMDAVDVAYQALAREDPHELIELTCDKRRDGEPLADMALKLETVDLEYRSSCVVRTTDFGDPELAPDHLALRRVEDQPGITQDALADVLVQAGTDKAGAYRLIRKLAATSRIMVAQWDQL